ncbi:MAG: hypothetical protein ACFN00_02795 [Flavobacteriaceae bacterium]
MRISWYALFLLLGINVWGQEQEIEPINTDRPDQNIIYLLGWNIS